MRVSVFLGPLSLGWQQDKPNIDLCIEQAIAAAEAGFAMVTFGEQHFNGYEPYSNPFLMAARLAPHLGDTWFGTTIVPLVLHHPLRLAEDASVVDLLLGGRFIMGMSAGRVGFSPDFPNFGLDPERRYEIFESKLAILQAAFAHQPGDPPVVMDTDWDHGKLDGRLMPASHRAGGPLLAIGTNTDATIVRTAERGMSVFLGPCLLDEAAAKFAAYRAAVGGPDTEGLVARSQVTRHVIVGRTTEEAWNRAERMAGRNPMIDRSSDRRSLREMSQADPVGDRNASHVQSWIIAGSPDEVSAQLLAYREAGVPQLLTRFTVGPYLPDDVRESFSLFTAEVLPGLKAPLFPPLTSAEIRSDDTAVVAAPAANGAGGELTGRWVVAVATPMGNQHVQLDLQRDRDTVTGTAEVNGTTRPVLDGQSAGGRWQWRLELTKPFPMALAYDIRVDGDAMSGTVTAGNFPPSRLTGNRA